MPNLNKKEFLSWTPIVIFLSLICSLLWGSAFPFIKLGLKLFDIEQNTGGKLFFAGVRFFLAGILVFITLLISGHNIRMRQKKDYLWMILLGLLQTTLLYSFFYVGLSNTTGVKSAIINGSASFYLALFSHFWLKGDRLTARKATGLILGFTGIILVNLQQGELDFCFSLKGEGFMVLASLCGATASFIVKKNSLKIHPPLLAAYHLTLGGVGLFIVACFFESPDILKFSVKSSLILAYLSFASACAFSLWFLLITHNQLSKIAVYRFMIPICGTLLSLTFLENEAMNRNTLLALLLVSAGIFITSKKEAEAENKIREKAAS